MQKTRRNENGGSLTVPLPSRSFQDPFGVRVARVLDVARLQPQQTARLAAPGRARGVGRPSLAEPAPQLLDRAAAGRAALPQGGPTFLSLSLSLFVSYRSMKCADRGVPNVHPTKK